MLDEKDLLAIAQLMDQKLEQKLAQQKREILDEATHRMNILLETKVQKQLDLLAEGQRVILEKLDTKVDREEYENRVSTIEAVVKAHSRELAELRLAQ